MIGDVNSQLESSPFPTKALICPTITRKEVFCVMEVKILTIYKTRKICSIPLLTSTN